MRFISFNGIPTGGDAETYPVLGPHSLSRNRPGVLNMARPLHNYENAVSKSIILVASEENLFLKPSESSKFTCDVMSRFNK